MMLWLPYRPISIEEGIPGRQATQANSGPRWVVQSMLVLSGHMGAVYVPYTRLSSQIDW